MHLVGRVAEIWRYPVKSLAGESLATAELSADGMTGDRSWALRNVDTGKLLSAKLPRVAAALLSCSARLDGAGAVVRVGGDDFRIGETALLGALGEVLGCRVAIEQRGSETPGAYESEWPEIDGVDLRGTHDFPVALMTQAATFADLAGLHVLTTASMTTLRQLAPDSAIDVRRFRPGIVVESATEPGAFEENEWTGRRMTIGGAGMVVTMSTMRCVMTTVAQPGLPRDLSVLRTLAAHNRQHFEGAGHFACLGAYAEVTAAGLVSVGDEVRLDG